MHSRHSLLIGFAAVAFGGLSACGGSTGSEVIARVDGVGTITKASLDHWTRVETILVHELIPSRPAPNGLTPDPPDYTACIAYQRTALRQAGEKATALTSVALKSKCSQKERELRT